MVGVPRLARWRKTSLWSWSPDACGPGCEYLNLVSVLNDALRGTDACARYALDAEVTSDEGLANVFPKVQKVHAEVAGQAEGMLDLKDAEP